MKLSEPMTIAMDCDHEPDDRGVTCWSCTVLLVNRAEAAEARAAELLESNRELSEALEIVKAERDEWRELCLLRGVGIDDIIAERDEARQELEKAIEAGRSLQNSIYERKGMGGLKTVEEYAIMTLNRIERKP